MVDVSSKKPQLRRATARGRISIAPSTADLIARNEMKKGDVLTLAEVAGINAAKRTSELIPLCHPLGLTKVDVEAALEEDGVSVSSEVVCIGPTGVEMEALTAVSVALLTVYDMCKAVDKQMRIGDIVLVEKTKSDIHAADVTLGTSEKAADAVLRPGASGTVVSVNISEEKGTPKTPLAEIAIDGRGVVGDAHAGNWQRQVSLLGQETIDEFVAATGRQTRPGEFAENITTRGIDLRKVSVLDRFEIGDVRLEVTQIGKKCHGEVCAIYREVGQCAMPKEGIFCRVILGGKVAASDSITHLMRPLRFKVITMSDRASRGDYQDRSGPKVRELIEEFFAESRWHIETDGVILPDDEKRLRGEIEQSRRDGVDVIITTGGTGVGPRDITPEVVRSMADKVIPGIMEHIREKFGAEKPNALLSRSVAAVLGKTLVYTLPGSSRAVEEYMRELLKTLEHLIFTLHDLDPH
jgi:molybdenum cofactor biosynthesis protein MoaC